MIPQHGTLEISRSRLAHNVALFREHLGKQMLICAALKADAYGHGSNLVSPLLIDVGVKWCAVYSFEELAAHRDHPWEGILVLSPLVLPPRMDHSLEARLLDALKENVRVTVSDGESAVYLGSLAHNSLGRPIPVHIQVDTGLTRLGVTPDAAEELAWVAYKHPGLRLEGLYAHFSHGDVPGHETLLQQSAILHQTAARLREKRPNLMVHLQNSGGAWNLQPPASLGLDMVRLGIALYGLQPSTDHPIPGLQPIARLTAPILAIHRVPPGTGVGYGHTFVTKRTTWLGIVPVGYADGYPRSYSNKGKVLVNGKPAPVVGRISMDLMTVDLTENSQAVVGDEVTLLDNDPLSPVSVYALSQWAETIPYEIFCRIGKRVPRVAVAPEGWGHAESRQTAVAS